MDDVEVYAVGLLAALLRDYRRIVEWRSIPRKVRVGAFTARSLRYLRERAKRREWRAFRSHFNGYLAEPSGRKSYHWTRCGHGWTPGRARRDLARHIRELNHAA